MKTTITVEDGKVTVQVDDQSPVTVAQSPPIIATDGALSPRPAGRPKGSPNNGRPETRPKGVRSYLPTTKKCLGCETVFPPKRYDSKFCSKKCGVRFHNRKQRQKLPKEGDDARQELERQTEERRAAFDDPWDCQMCRNASDLCDMHEKMEREGQKPPSPVQMEIRQ